MELQVWLMRHSEAVDPDSAPRDEERALTDRGRRQSAALGRWLNGRMESPQLVLHSPLRRARETAEAFARGFGDDVPVMELRALLPGMRSGELLDVLQRHGVARVVCIGHQPDLSQCLAMWVGGGNAQFAPGALAIVTFAAARSAGTGILRGLLNPIWFEDR
jgi:phosphohistidine phosphatase